MVRDVLPGAEELLQGLNCALPEFLAGPLRNAYLGPEGLTLYARKSSRLWQGAVLPCLDVATVELHPALRGLGVGKRVFDRIEALARAYRRCVYVENVLNPVLEQLLLKRGIYASYEREAGSGAEGPRSYLGFTIHPADVRGTSLTHPQRSLSYDF